MKPFAWGAIALVIWTILVFVVGRATIPDLSQEVKDWREGAQVALVHAEELNALWVADSARAVAALTRADNAEMRLAAARSVERAQQARTAALEEELAQVATLVDTARVQAAIIESQRETILGLSVSLGDAQEFLRDARMDLAMVNQDRQEVVAENQRLQAVIAAGLGVTQPSRGKPRPIRCVLGAGATTGGSGVGGMCGLAVL